VKKEPPKGAPVTDSEVESVLAILRGEGAAGTI
jgi:hypothetical protein